NLAYTFIETVTFMHLPYVVRAIGGMFFVAGILLMVYNVYMTIAQAKRGVAVELSGAAALAR
ncbi:MAG: cytochrome C oxidase Cbb3, partial [Halothiobacillaceae bacterium]